MEGHRGRRLTSLIFNRAVHRLRGRTDRKEEMPVTPVDTRRVQQVSDFLASIAILSNAVNELLVEGFREQFDGPLALSQYKLLRLIRYADTVRISDVATCLGVSTAATSKAVERLVRRGLLYRAHLAGDRRASSLHLTSAGRQLLDRSEAVHRRLLSDIFADCGAETLAGTADLLDRLAMEILNQPGRAPEPCLRCGVHFRDRCLLRGTPSRICHGRPHEGAHPDADPANQGVEPYGTAGSEDGV